MVLMPRVSVVLSSGLTRRLLSLTQGAFSQLPLGVIKGNCWGRMGLYNPRSHWALGLIVCMQL